MIKSLPEIDVIIPFHKLNLELKQAIDSAQNSQGVDIRLVLVNDTGGDSVLTVVNPSVEFIEIFTETRGYTSALKAGVRASDRPYIGFLDSDDLTDPQRFEKSIDSLRRTESDLVTGVLIPVSSQGKILKDPLILGEIPKPKNIRELLLLGSHGADSSLVANGDFLRGTWKNHELFPSAFADYSWLVGLAGDTRITHRKDAKYFYRKHSGQMSREVSAQKDWEIVFPHLVKNWDKNFSQLTELRISEDDLKVVGALIFPSLLFRLNKSEKIRLVEISDKIINSLVKRGEKDLEIRKWEETLNRRVLIATRMIKPKNIFVTSRLAVSLLSSIANGARIRNNS